MLERIVAIDGGYGGHGVASLVGLLLRFKDIDVAALAVLADHRAGLVVNQDDNHRIVVIVLVDNRMSSVRRIHIVGASTTASSSSSAAKGAHRCGGRHVIVVASEATGQRLLVIMEYRRVFMPIASARCPSSSTWQRIGHCRPKRLANHGNHSPPNKLPQDSLFIRPAFQKNQLKEFLI